MPGCGEHPAGDRSEVAPGGGFVMKLRLPLSALAMAAALFMAAPASAQVTDIPLYEVGIGYQLVRSGEVCDEGIITETCVPDRAFPFGLNGDVVRNFGAYGLGVVGEIGFSRDSEGDVSFGMWNFGAGIRWTGRNNPRIAPYGQLLIGVVRSSLSDDETNFDASTTDFMVQPGGGVNFLVNERVKVFGQVDLRRVSLGDVGTDDDFTGLPILVEDVTRTDFRVVLGVRFGL
jgi:hypothetical protein